MMTPPNLPRWSMVLQQARGRLGMLWLPLCLLGTVDRAVAQELRDPTRPPSSLSLPAGSIETPSSSGMQLHSVRISRRQASAIISGQQVRIGDQVGAYRVVAITENDVTLRSPSGQQILKLFPGIGKRSVAFSAPTHHRHARAMR